MNCAGHRDRAPLVELTVESFDRMLAVHVRGTFLGIRGCARRWRAAERRGSVVAISSVNATHAVPGQPHYAAAKAGVSGLVRRPRSNWRLPGSGSTRSPPASSKPR